MKKPPRDPDVADAAPTDPVLTVYDEEHIITYCACLMRTRRGRTGARSRKSCCTSIQILSITAQSVHLILT